MKSENNKQIALNLIKEAREKRAFFLNLSGLNLSELPEDISDLTCLIEIDLSFNFFSILPKSVASLQNLHIINISNNYLSEINFLEGPWYALRKINISNNLIYEIPDSLNYLPNCESIEFEGNPFLDEVPISLRQYNLWYIQEYFNLNKYREKQRFYETKLIFVGNGEVGKTTLIKVLKDPLTKIIPGQEETTHGIKIDKIDFDIFFPAKPPYYNHHSEIEEVYVKFSQDELEICDFDYDEKIEDEYYKQFAPIFGEMDDESQLEVITNPYLGRQFAIKKSIRTNLWDFGGQEIYHSTHQFFLTKRSIYIFVWEPRRDEYSNDFDYWLDANVTTKTPPVTRRR